MLFWVCLLGSACLVLAYPFRSPWTLGVVGPLRLMMKGASSSSSNAVAAHDVCVLIAMWARECVREVFYLSMRPWTLSAVRTWGVLSTSLLGMVTLRNRGWSGFCWSDAKGKRFLMSLRTSCSSFFETLAAAKVLLFVTFGLL